MGGWEGGSRGRGMGTHVYIWLIHFGVQTETNTVLRSNYTPIKIYLKTKITCVSCVIFPLDNPGLEHGFLPGSRGSKGILT